jgi:hypothetical protein
VLDPNKWTAGGELTEAGMAVRSAQRLVERRVIDQARSVGGQLVVGADLKLSVHEVPCGWEGCRVNDLDIDIAWFGTAIRGNPHMELERQEVPPLILGMMPLGRRKRGEVVEGEEDESAELAREGREEEERAAEEAERGGGGEE